MFQKVHIRLTLLCTGITAAILIIMSLFYLKVSENGLYKNQFQSFKNDINTIATNLEQQTVISMEWLAKMEAYGNYTFFVLDNNVPFLYNRLSGTKEDETKNILLAEGLDAYHEMNVLPLSEEHLSYSPFRSYHKEYEFTSPSMGTHYFGSVIIVERNSASLQVVILSSLTSLEKQIHQQRFRFFIIDLSAVFLLTVFSFLFTGMLLKPIKENQIRQTQFVASASHELRTPLAVILSAAECCETADHIRQKSFLNTIRQEGLRMSSLINDMLTLSLSDNHRLSMEIGPVELDTLVLNSYESFLLLAGKKSISLSVNLPEHPLPSCRADSKYISQVISILLHNAISYTPENGKIQLSLSYHTGKFFISVCDNGIGITDKDKSKVFDRFYRTEKSRSTKGHFGLGLSIAYEIVKAHKGDIRITDAAGGGSVFTVILPA